MKKLLLLSSLNLLWVPMMAQTASLSGFKAANQAAQYSLEKQFDAGLSKAHIGEIIKEFSSSPHHLGSARGKAVAGLILDQFKSYGWDAKIETYYVLFPTPNKRSLEMISPVKFQASLEEQEIASDPSTSQKGQLPPYNAWGADGDVTAGLIFVNYGLPEDYEKLERLGIDVKGKIVIAKYGHSWRGVKPKIAYEHGAIGCLIYSDPEDDGFVKGDTYPAGAFKPEYAVQRGSVMDMVIYPGDPLTPGAGATKGAKRLSKEEAQTILKIPVQPISYHDAQPLLAALKGPVAPAEWSGGLPVTYHVGDGATTVRLNLSFNWDIVPAYNVIAVMKGSAYPDEWVIRGNHHDAWVHGAADPVSGLAALLEEAKSIGQLAKQGKRPKRTLIYAAWDGEEPSLLGSTEWAEDHTAELNKKAVAYINSDGNGRGFLEAGGSHALENMISEVARTVNDPQANVSIFDRKIAAEAVAATSAKAKQTAMSKKVLDISALGTGSDYSTFLQHLGIPSLNLGFGGEDQGGEYHTNFDSYANYIKFKDPDFSYGLALSQTAGRAVLRLANADVLPFNFENLQVKIAKYISEVTDLDTQLRENAKATNQLVKGGMYKMAADPQEKLKDPKLKTELPVVDYTALKTAVDSLKAAAKNLNQAIVAGLETIKQPAKLNAALYQAEKQLLSDAGLPKRPWYKHTIYAPGFYTGYGVKTIPGVREGLEQYQAEEVKQQVAILTTAVLNLSAYLNKAAALVK
jgi:N-acetylated-alpha-linked acidic dipeptidase